MIRMLFSKGKAEVDKSWVITTKVTKSYGKSKMNLEKDSYAPKPYIPEKRRLMGIDKWKHLQEKALIRKEKLASKEPGYVPPPPPAPLPFKNTKWFQTLSRMDNKIVKETTVSHQLKSLKPPKLAVEASLVSNDDGGSLEPKKRKIPGVLISHLKGFSQDGSIIPPRLPKGDPRLETIRMKRMASKVCEELNYEVNLKKLRDLVDESTNSCPVFTRVKMTQDLRKATVYWLGPSSFEEINKYEKIAWAKRLVQNTGRLKKGLGLRMQTRFVPELVFKFDEEENASSLSDDEEEEDNEA